MPVAPALLSGEPGDKLRVLRSDLGPGEGQSSLRLEHLAFCALIIYIETQNRLAFGM